MLTALALLLTACPSSQPAPTEGSGAPDEGSATAAPSAR